VGIVVESTYNWYWLVDGLMEEGYKVHLANPSAIKQYEGLKHSDDVREAFFLAQLLKLGILPEGYIYPKEERPVRDLLSCHMIMNSLLFRLCHEPEWVGHKNQKVCEIVFVWTWCGTEDFLVHFRRKGKVHILP